MIEGAAFRLGGRASWRAARKTGSAGASPSPNGSIMAARCIKEGPNRLAPAQRNHFCTVEVESGRPLKKASMLNLQELMALGLQEVG